MASSIVSLLINLNTSTSLILKEGQEIYGMNGKWFEPRSLGRLCGLIVRVRVVPRRTVVGDIDRRSDNLSGSHHQSHVNCVSSVYGIYVSRQLSSE